MVDPRSWTGPIIRLLSRPVVGLSLFVPEITVLVLVLVLPPPPPPPPPPPVLVVLIGFFLLGERSAPPLLLPLRDLG